MYAMCKPYVCFCENRFPVIELLYIAVIQYLWPMAYITGKTMKLQYILSSCKICSLPIKTRQNCIDPILNNSL